MHADTCWVRGPDMNTAKNKKTKNSEFVTHIREALGLWFSTWVELCDFAWFRAWGHICTYGMFGFAFNGISVCTSIWVFRMISRDFEWFCVWGWPARDPLSTDGCRRAWCAPPASTATCATDIDTDTDTETETETETGRGTGRGTETETETETETSERCGREGGRARGGRLYICIYKHTYVL